MIKKKFATQKFSAKRSKFLSLVITGLGVTHVNLVFDFGSIANDLKKRLEYAKQIKDAIIPSVLAR